LQAKSGDRFEKNNFFTGSPFMNVSKISDTWLELPGIVCQVSALLLLLGHVQQMLIPALI
jgi:hypothetical protein